MVLCRPASAQAAPPPPHLAEAEALVSRLQGATENHYGGGKRHIDWDAQPCAARTVCSSFVTLLLMHSYALSEADFEKWFTHADPVAADYHEAVARHDGFQQIRHARDIRPGDVLAVKYTDGHRSRNGVEDTGHVMIVAGELEPVAGATEAAPGARLYQLWVIDSSASGHGAHDTRHRGKGEFTGGIGKGILRLAVDRTSDEVVAYAWSDAHNSEFFTSPSRDLVVGRLALNGGH
jgi:hypothetical protein